MREALKVLTVLVFMFAAPAAAVAWADSRPDFVFSILRWACPVLSVLAIAAFLKIHFRPDLAPDYLHQKVGEYFNRNGFCFAIRPSAVDGICCLEVYFQNQQDRPCISQIALRPARGFFLDRAKIETIAIEINCEPAAYGIVAIQVAVPETLQGKKQPFEVGASVEYPSGKGRTLRFRSGKVLRANSKFGNAFGKAIYTAGVAMASPLIVLIKPATVTLNLPTAVDQAVPAGLRPEIKTLWKLGDPPLQGNG